MSVAAAQADAFYREFLAEGVVFTVKDAGGYPQPFNGSGQRSQPFWSKRSRAQRIVDQVHDYRGFEVVEIQGERWLEHWLPLLARDGILVGLNWSGRSATGDDLTSAELLRNLDARERHGR